MTFLRYTAFTLAAFIVLLSAWDSYYQPPFGWHTSRDMQFIVVAGSFLAGLICWLITRAFNRDRYNE